MLTLVLVSHRPLLLFLCTILATSYQSHYTLVLSFYKTLLICLICPFSLSFLSCSKMPIMVQFFYNSSSVHFQVSSINIYDMVCYGGKNGLGDVLQTAVLKGSTTRTLHSHFSDLHLTKLNVIIYFTLQKQSVSRTPCLEFTVLP